MATDKAAHEDKPAPKPTAGLKELSPLDKDKAAARKGLKDNWKYNETFQIYTLKKPFDYRSADNQSCHVPAEIAREEAEALDLECHRLYDKNPLGAGKIKEEFAKERQEAEPTA